MAVQSETSVTGPILPEPTPLTTRRMWLAPAIAAVIGALLTGAVSFAILTGLTAIKPDETVTWSLIVINAGFILLLVALIGREIGRLLLARRTGKAASRLHIRIVTMFSLVAALPAILVAVIASVTLDVGLDRWFEQRTKAIVSSSLAIAESYVRENASNLQGTALSMAYVLDQNRTVYRLDRNGFRRLLTEQAQGRALAHAALINDKGEFLMMADIDTGFKMPDPPIQAVERAADGDPVLIEPRFRNIVGSIVKLRQISGLYLYTVRLVDAEVIDARRIVRANADEYSGMEANRTSTQVAFALIYLGVTLIVVLSAILTGIAVADRLVRPIRQLIGAADEVATGNLDVSVTVRASDGDVGSLGDTFNKMIQQLKSQRHDLLTAKDQIDERRRFSEAVLSGVTSAVIGVDADGNITIVNRSATEMLGLSERKATGARLNKVLPQVGKVFEVAKSARRKIHREQVAFLNNGSERTFNIQITVEERQAGETGQSYVVTIDDITDLVQAQRSTAWADVARRIAHEIKNPLTPIQLSAERIKRRYGKVITEDREVFDQCTDTIVRQVGDIGRMVDEFSAFARMPKPSMQKLDLREVLREASFLVEVSRAEIAFERDYGDEPLVGLFDNRLMSQAFGNIIKNAAEATETAVHDSDETGVIRIEAKRHGDTITVDVMDNGRGLPKENRQRLLEPYMTTREKGTGLGLAIVRKIVEDHGGTLELHDAPQSFHGGRGAMIRVIVPAAETGDAAGREANRAAEGKQQEVTSENAV
ncbi:MAG: PAS domain-containing sensor histidine kinase [Rhizobiaceae bacterium]